MTEFTKLKIGFALALLGTLFALHPLLDRYPEAGFLYLGTRLKVAHVYALTSGLLSLCVYLYAVTLLNEHPHSWCERTGNSVYALAVLVLPIYAGLFLSAELADRVAVSHVAWAAPAVAFGLGGGWIMLTQVVAWRIRRRLGERDRVAKMEQLALQETRSLDRARELLAGEHYDLVVIEAWKALESRLRQALLSRGIAAKADDPGAILRLAARKGLLREPIPGLVEDLRRSWSVAISTEPLPREAAVEALGAIRYVLSILPAQPISPGGRSRADLALAPAS